MRIAQTTSACRRLAGGEPSPIEIAEKLALIGYTAVDFSFTDAAKSNSVSPLRQKDWKDWCRNARQQLQDMGMPGVQSHAPIFNFLSREVEQMDEKMEMTRRAVAASGLLGIPWVVIHPGTDYENNRCSVNLVKNREFFRPLLELAAQYQTGIAIENLFDTYHHPVGVSGSSETQNRRADHHLICQRRFGSYPEELLELADWLAEEYPNVGICWDFGHANEAGLDQVNALEMLGKRVKAIHVNDNTAVFDDHLTPFCGSVKWEEIMPCLQQIGYEGAFVYENTKFLARLPKELMEAALRYSLEVAIYLTGLCK